MKRCQGCGSTEGHNHFDWMRDCPVWNRRIELALLPGFLRDYAKEYVRREKADRQAAEKIFNRLIAADDAANAVRQ
jgi:hypothetical protein